MKRFIFSLLSALSLLSCKHDATATQSWNGTYVYEADLGETASGVTAVVTYRLSLSDDSCQLQIEGYQADDAVVCKTTESGDALTVAFLSYIDGSTKNAYGIRIYNPNQKLFSLTRTRGNILRTEWRALKPDDRLHSRGRYFQKVAR